MALFAEAVVLWEVGEYGRDAEGPGEIVSAERVCAKGEVGIAVWPSWGGCLGPLSLAVSWYGTLSGKKRVGSLTKTATSLRRG